MQASDTIAAISSAVGGAARMIVRASGADAERILCRLCRGITLVAGAQESVLRVGALSAPVWVYWFNSPKSYTGDDLAEVHLPGNPVLARMVLEEMIRLGARQAEAGEFTARAYFNGRIDLSQAEGVAAVVAAQNQAELDAGRRLMAGELSRRLRPLMDQLAQTLALIEAEIDFSDQDVRFLSAGEAARRLGEIDAGLISLLQNSSRLAGLSHEPTVALAGRPNAGKSTLLNALSASARAIVSPVAGTTRDVISAAVELDRGMIRLMDMAGVDDADSILHIESAMKRRAIQAMERAEILVLVRPADDRQEELKLGREPDLVVVTKIDLCARENWRAATTVQSRSEVAVSALSGAGMQELRRALDGLAFGAQRSGAELALGARHVQAIAEARDALGRAAGSAAELMAAELRTALDSLGRVLGDVSPDEILGRIFSTFCIGK